MCHQPSRLIDPHRQHSLPARRQRPSLARRHRFDGEDRSFLASPRVSRFPAATGIGKLWRGVRRGATLRPHALSRNLLLRESASDTSVIDVNLVVDVSTDQALARREEDVPPVAAGIDELRVLDVLAGRDRGSAPQRTTCIRPPCCWCRGKPGSGRSRRTPRRHRQTGSGAAARAFVATRCWGSGRDPVGRRASCLPSARTPRRTRTSVGLSHRHTDRPARFPPCPAQSSAHARRTRSGFPSSFRRASRY